jgi:hypothetical protein
MGRFRRLGQRRIRTVYAGTTETRMPLAGTPIGVRTRSASPTVRIEQLLDEVWAA